MKPWSSVRPCRGDGPTRSMCRVRVSPVVQSASAGGAERYMVRLYSALHGNHGIDPHLIGHVPGWTDDALPSTDPGLGPKWSGLSTLLRVPNVPRERASVRDTVRRLDPAVIHMQFKREQISLTGAVVAEAPVVWTEHGRFLRGAQGRALAIGYRSAAQRVASIICVDAVVADDVRAVVGPKPRIETIPNAVDTSLFSPVTATERQIARSALGIEGAGPMLAWVGRMDPGKLPLLAAAVARAFDGVVVMAGTGSLADEVRGIQSPKCRMLGHVDDPKPIYRAADALLFTSTGAGEGMPYVLLEAASCGLPIVTNKSSGFAPIVRAAGGVVGDDDPPSLARAAVKATGDEWADRSAQARTWAERHDEDSWTRLHLDLLQGAAADG